MRTNSISFPHPVLGIRDDVKVGHYRASANRVTDQSGTTIKFEVQHELSNPAIEKLLREGSVVFAVEISCSTTLFRKTFTSSESAQIIKVPAKDLRDGSDIQFFVVCAKEILAYRPSGMNLDYGKESFTLSRGDVIACALPGFFMVGRKWTPEREIRSIFDIQFDKDRPGNGPIRTILGSQSIIIYLNKNDLENVKRTARIFPRSYVASLYLPALVEALGKIVGGQVENDFPDGYPVWYEAIELKKASIEKIKDVPISKENILEISQYILDLPIERQTKELSEARNQMSKDH